MRTALGLLARQSENKNTVLSNLTAPLCICYIVSVTVRAETLTLEDCFQGHIFGQKKKEC